jgi:hypothetical protein
MLQKSKLSFLRKKLKRGKTMKRRKTLTVLFMDGDDPISAWIETVLVKSDGEIVKEIDFKYPKSKKVVDRMMADYDQVDEGTWSGETFASLIYDRKNRKYGKGISGFGRFRVYDLGS